MTLEWSNDGRMTGVSQFNFFLPLQKHPHSTSFRHSFVIWKYLEWQGMNIHNWEISFKSHFSHSHFIPSSFVVQEWWWNDGMRWNEGIFLNQGKTLNSQIHLIPPSFRHSMSISYSSYDHCNHLRVIPSFHPHSIIPSSNLNNQTGSLRGRQMDHVYASDILYSENLIHLPPP